MSDKFCVDCKWIHYLGNKDDINFIFEAQTECRRPGVDILTGIKICCIQEALFDERNNYKASIYGDRCGVEAKYFKRGDDQ